MSAQPLPAPPEELTRLLDGLDGASLWWISGYAAALARAQTAAPAIAPPVTSRMAPVVQESARLTVVYGSQTGNARRIAEQTAREAEAAGLTVRLLRADAYPLRELASERLLYVVISTQGDGDPPDDAQGFVEHLAGKRAPKLAELKYAVLGLGDSSYPLFCAVGRKLDARLAELGAQRLFAAGEADVDVDTVAAPWRQRALAAARETLRTDTVVTPLPGAPPPGNVAALPGGARVTPLRPPAAAAWTRERPWGAELLSAQRITARGSRKHVRHLEFSLAGSGLSYQPGDALGVWHRNPAALVEAVLRAARVEADDGLRERLAAGRELTRLSRPFLAAHAEAADEQALRRLLEPARQDELAGLLATHQVIDVLRRWPATWDADAFAQALRPLQPRLYSIASSQKAVGDEVHLTLDVLGYEAFGEPHFGAASRHLAEMAEGTSASVYIEPNERFRLPADGARDTIMIGPGTGVAPFRAFLQERIATGAGGRNWLFFGNPHFRSDFLYQLEWQAALKAGTLHELDLAFSRDGAGKVYVQHRIAQRGAQLHAWLDGGAHLYVCGATAMGRDVHAALREVVARERGLDAEDAEQWLRELQRAGRYSTDVY
jgi:sulfite reductase (NADPH) flavoprotein alpha-component